MQGQGTAGGKPFLETGDREVLLSVEPRNGLACVERRGDPAGSG